MSVCIALLLLVIGFCFLSQRENMPSHFKFKEYCPLVFRNLREKFSIDDQEYQVYQCLGVILHTLLGKFYFMMSIYDLNIKKCVLCKNVL